MEIVKGVGGEGGSGNGKGWMNSREVGGEITKVGRMWRHEGEGRQTKQNPTIRRQPPQTIVHTDKNKQTTNKLKSSQQKRTEFIFQEKRLSNKHRNNYTNSWRIEDGPRR